MIIKKANISNVLKNIYFSKNEPVSLVHFITNRCNARCSFCFIDFDNPKTFQNELTMDQIDILTKNLGNSLLNVNLTGGEPFARRDITDIAKSYLKNSTIQSIYVTTNASLPERIENFTNEISSFAPDVELCFQISIDDLPKRHDSVRKIKNLFDSCIDAYKRLKNFGPKVNPVVNITVSHENCDDIKKIFSYLNNDCKIEYIKCCIVRDEGVYKTPEEKKKKIFEAYSWLTNEIKIKTKSGKILNYNSKSIQGKLHQKKDLISWEMVKKMYLKPKYISPCHAAGLFGIITANGLVYPCEILENKLMGNLRDIDMQFMKIWKSDKTRETKKYILKNKCNCTYECALTYNILGNLRYQPSLIASMFNLS